jgi:phosphatidylglycerol:prolipoprotein diacylglycerol transferase
MFSRSGLNFDGLLIVATSILYYNSKKTKIRFAHLCDAAAPALILAYGIGRLGCQFAGDGDWGIYNSAYVTSVDGNLEKVAPEKYRQALAEYKSTLRYPSHVDSMHRYAPAPDWAPRWMWAQNYPRNVGRDGILLNDCPDPEYCTVLPIGVFPTPVYESIICIGLFFFLWGIRHRMRRPWQMFGVYLIVNGLERFLVEQIRVNYKYDWGFIHPTQAEIIAVSLMLCGVLLLLLKDKAVNKPAVQ